MTLNPYAPILKPTTHSRLIPIYRPDLRTKMEASTSQDIIDLTIPTKCPKTSPDSNSPTVSEQLHLLTSQVNQLRIDSQEAMDQIKPFVQTYPLANIKQFQYLHAVQQQVAQFFVDLNTEKKDRLKLCTTFCRLEDEPAQLRRQVQEPSCSSLPVPFTIDPPSSAAFQDSGLLGSIQILKPRVTNTLKRPSSTPSRYQPTEPPRSPLSSQTTSGHSLDLETRVSQLEEEITKAREGRGTIASIHRSQFAFLYDRIRALECGGSDTILWKLTAFRLVFDTAKSAARLDNAATNPSTHYNSPVYRTHPHGYNFFIQFYFYGLNAAAGNHASIMFALFPGDYVGLLTSPFPKTIHLSVCDQLDPQNKWTTTFTPSERTPFRRPTREPHPTLTNLNFSPHSKMFSRTENFF